MSRRLMILLSVLALAVGVLTPVAAGAETTDDSVPYVDNADGDYIVVTLNGKAAANDDATKTHGRFDPTSQGYAKALERMERQHAKFATQLAKTAPNAEIVDDFYITANAVALKLNGSSESAIRKISGVERTAESALYSLDMDQSVGLIDADGFWAANAGRADTGDGVKVGVIDSGIDPGHPFFWCKTVEFGGVYASGVSLPPGLAATPAYKGPHYSPMPGDWFYFSSSHGTHVAGTIGGCVTEIGEDNAPWTGTTLSGVAPGATLVDYNVFPAFGAGFTAFGGSAFSHDIAAAIEDAVASGIDVINMSLGGTVQGPHDFLAEASNAAVAAGVVVVTSAGNEGPGSYTVGSPGSASEVIAVGASTNTRGMGIEIRVVDDGPVYDAVGGEFAAFDGSEYTVVDWGGDDNEACSSNLSTDYYENGEVVVIARGNCYFSVKMENAKLAGAGGAIIYTYEGGTPIGMAKSPGYDDDIPAVMVTYDDGKALEAGAQAVITPPTIVGTTPDELIDFSSRGPAPFTYIVKPDVVAPGVNILSSTVAFTLMGVTGSGWELYAGTSMASPHVAGAAAALLGEYGDWTPDMVKSAFVTRADVSKPGGTVWEQGGGLLDMVAADAASVFFYPANASFGIMKGNKPANGSVEIAISDGATCTAAASGSDYIDAEVDDSTLTVTFSGAREAETGFYDGYVDVDCGAGGTYHLPWGAVVNR